MRKLLPSKLSRLFSGKNSIRCFLLVAWLSGIAGAAKAADIKYAASEIPSELTGNAIAVIRTLNMSFEIQGRNKGTYKVLMATTILNGSAGMKGSIALPYNKLSKIIELKAAIYNKEGLLIRRLKQQDIYDRSAVDGYTLYSDDRVKSATLTHDEYPYTVEFEYTIDYKFLYSIPDCTVGMEKIAIQQLSYELLYPVEFRPRYKLVNVTTTPKVEAVDKVKEIMTWKFNNLKPFMYEPYGPPEAEVTPRIEVAPSFFEYGGFAGDMTSWESYGKWSGQMIKGMDILPEATRSKVREITTGLSSVEDKSKALYEYLQGKTRYVNIREGIGGLQPFPATAVDENGYGDCKALSNYMVALLKEAGIKGYYTRIRAGEDEPQIMTDFPSHQTNHVIVSIPNGSDTLWLECTSQKAPFNYLGRFTGNRHALMVTEQGGRLVRTPSLSPEQNTLIRKAEVTLQATGNAAATLSTNYFGEQAELEGIYDVMESSREDQRKWLQNEMQIPSFTISSFSVTSRKARIPHAALSAQLVLDRYASASGSRLFITPNLMNRLKRIPEKVEGRKTKVVRDLGFVDIDTIVFKLPPNYHPEFVPPAIQYRSVFGEYDATVEFSEGKILYARRLKMIPGRFPPESYEELIRFYKDINKSDNIRLVMVNKS